MMPFLTLALYEQDLETFLLFYGPFRHWKHPAGFKKLYKRVHVSKEIDMEYANLLASDLAMKVLRVEFGKQKRWFVDLDRLSPSHDPFTKIYNRQHLAYENEIDQFGDKWHNMPLMKCYTNVPDFLDPAFSTQTRAIPWQEESSSHIFVTILDNLCLPNVFCKLLFKNLNSCKKSMIKG